jgi:hypothetical protein
MTNLAVGYICGQNIAFSVQRYKKSIDYTKKMKKNKENRSIFLEKVLSQGFFERKISINHFFFVILQAEKYKCDKSL